MRAWPSHLGAPGLVALLALLTALPLAAWFTPQWQEQAAGRRPAPLPVVTAAPAPVLPTLPQVGDPAERVADLLALALRHGVAVDRTQQQRQQQGAVAWLQLGLAAHGRYADLRSFIAAALQADAGLALDTLQLRRASAEATDLEADLQWSLLQAGTSNSSAALAATRQPWQGKVVAAAWSGPPAPPPPAPAAPAKPPTPAFPYRWIGRLDDGSDAQALLSGPQRSFGARAGDVLDGRWRLDKVAAARLQLTWLPTGEAVTVDTR